MHVDEVRRYYEQNTRRFLTLGQGGAEGAIHRAVWGKGVEDRREAFHFVHELVFREAKTLQQPLRALDLGCGVGACLLYLAERLPIEGIGITLSPLQVELARKRVAAHPTVSLIEFVEADFEHLPAIEPVDLATAIESFIHGSDPNRFMNEAAKVVRPGGKLVVCDDFLADEPLTAQASDRALLDEFKAGWHAGNLETVGTVDQIAQRHGFELTGDTDLTPDLELGRLRDRAIAAWVRVGKWAGTKNKYLQAMVGGNALQRCLREGLVQYRFLVWTAKGQASNYSPSRGSQSRHRL